MRSELFVSRSGNRTWAALREDGETVEFRVEDRGSGGPRVGRIVRGRVTRVLPGMQAAFVDVGMERDGFLHASDLLLPEDRPPEVGSDAPIDDLVDSEDEGDGDDLAARPRPWAASRSAPIQDRLKVGRDVVVQISRDAIGAKGARLTSFVALPGRWLVYLPHLAVRGVSRRIRDAEERARLRAALAALPHPGGFIVRTAGRGAPGASLEADAAALAGAWHRIRREAEHGAAPVLLHGDHELALRLLRDAPVDGFEAVHVDDPGLHARAVDYLRDVDPVAASRVRLHDAETPLFEVHGLDRDLDRALRPRVWLKSGGTVVLEQTEALVSIDVNTGKYVGSRHPEETVLRTNLEAAVEIARQLRLRDLGGIIVVDFIDMAKPASRRRVLETLEAELARDRARTKVVGLSELGLLQLTRKRTRAGLSALLTRACPTCQGSGRLKSPDTVVSEVLRELRWLMARFDGGTVTIRAHPDVARAVRPALPGELGPRALERVRLEEDATMAPDGFDLLAV